MFEDYVLLLSVFPVQYPFRLQNFIVPWIMAHFYEKLTLCLTSTASCCKSGIIFEAFSDHKIRQIDHLMIRACNIKWMGASTAEMIFWLLKCVPTRLYKKICSYCNWGLNWGQKLLSMNLAMAEAEEIKD